MRSVVATRALILCALFACGAAAKINHKAELGKYMLQCRNKSNVKVAVVNDVLFHFEVVAGILSALSDFSSSLDVYLHPQVFSENVLGSYDLVRQYKASYKTINGTDFQQADLLVLVSPEYDTARNRELVRLLRPSTVLAFIHNGDSPHLPNITSLHAHTHLITLSPHVSGYVSARMNRTVNWLMPFHEFKAEAPCTAKHICQSGFVLQGLVTGKRRNYDSIWSQISSNYNVLRARNASKLYQFNVAGSTAGPQMQVPQIISDIVHFHYNLPFREFYKLIQRNLALIPALASEAYYSCKSSSTVATSLATGTPIIASKKVMTAYSFLRPSVVFLQGPGETELDVVKRIAEMKPQEYLKTRAALTDLRASILHRSKRIFAAFASLSYERRCSRHKFRKSLA